jgi:hypothetical protein
MLNSIGHCRRASARKFLANKGVRRICKLPHEPHRQCPWVGNLRFRTAGDKLFGGYSKFVGYRELNG